MITRFAFILICAVNTPYLCAMGETENEVAKQFFTKEHWEAFLKPLAVYFEDLALSSHKLAHEEMRKFHDQILNSEEFEHAAKSFKDIEIQCADIADIFSGMKSTDLVDLVFSEIRKNNSASDYL